MLPPRVPALTLANPILYMVEGLRFGMLGISDASPWTGAALLAVLALAAVGVAYALLRSGTAPRLSARAGGAPPGRRGDGSTR